MVDQSSPPCTDKTCPKSSKKPSRRYTRKKNNESRKPSQTDGKNNNVSLPKRQTESPRGKVSRISPEDKEELSTELPSPDVGSARRAKLDGDTSGRTVRKSRQSRKTVSKRNGKSPDKKMPKEISKPERSKMAKVRSSPESVVSSDRNKPERNESFRGFVKDLKESESNEPMHKTSLTTKSSNTSSKTNKSHPAVVGASSTSRVGRNQARTLRGRLTTGCVRKNESFRREKSSKKLDSSSSQLSLSDDDSPASPTCRASFVTDMNASFTGIKW